MDYSKYYLAEFKKYISATTSSINTLKNYLSDLRIFLKFINDQGLEVTPQNLVIYLTDPRLSQYESFLMEKNPLSTTKRRISSLKKFLEYCAAQGIVINTPPPPPPLPSVTLVKEGLPEVGQPISTTQTVPPLPIPPPLPDDLSLITPHPSKIFNESGLVKEEVSTENLPPAPQIHSPMFHELPDFSLLDDQLPIPSQPEKKLKNLFLKNLVIWFLVYLGIFLISLISTILVGLLISSS